MPARFLLARLLPAKFLPAKFFLAKFFPAKSFLSLLLGAAVLSATLPARAQDAAAPEQGILAPEDQPAPARKPKRRRAAAVATTVEESGERNELAGRYAVMREKRDTGCMLTLDATRAKGGDRAQLAPGCRDQGIVIFDPSTWTVVKGELVLTARAGHKARLVKNGEGAWAKDPKDGGKPLGLKKL